MAKLGLELNCTRYVELLEKLIGVSETLQNNPPRFVPTEDKCVSFLLLASKACVCVCLSVRMCASAQATTLYGYTD